MKGDKGKQVFTGNTGDLLADKIIRHSKENSMNSFSARLENNTETFCRPPKKFITILLALLSAAALLLLVIRAFSKKSDT
jgi:hypothetical protein